MIVLFCSIELADPIFSGNGVLARSMVEALLRRGHRVYAVCGVPSKQLDEAAATAACADPFSANSFLTSQLREGALKIHQVPLPVWRSVTHTCSYEQLARAAGVHRRRWGALALTGVQRHSSHG